MDFGKVRYLFEAQGARGENSPRSLQLTLIGQGDADTLGKKGLAGLRRARIIRLTNEAIAQDSLLSYEDLSSLLLTSLATLKRDVMTLEKQGHHVPLKGRRKNGCGKADEE